MTLSGATAGTADIKIACEDEVPRSGQCTCQVGTEEWTLKGKSKEVVFRCHYF